MAEQTTVEAVRRRIFDIAPKLGVATKDGITTLQASGGSSNTLVDISGPLPSAGAASKLYHNWYLWMPDASDDRDISNIIDTYTGATRTITIQGAFQTNPTSGDEYHITRHDPWMWWRAMVRAARVHVFFRDDVIVTPTDNEKRLFTLGSDGFTGFDSDLRLPSEIHDIWWQNTSDDQTDDPWRPWRTPLRGWRAYGEDASGTPNVHIEFTTPPTTDRRLKVITTPHYELANLTGSTNVSVEPDWWAYASILEMARMVMNRRNPDDPFRDYIRDAQRAVAHFRIKELGPYAGSRVEDTWSKQAAFRV